MTPNHPTALVILRFLTHIVLIRLSHLFSVFTCWRTRPRLSLMNWRSRWLLQMFCSTYLVQVCLCSAGMIARRYKVKKSIILWIFSAWTFCTYAHKVIYKFIIAFLETSRNMQSERMLRLVNHLIEQRRFYCTFNNCLFICPFIS